MRAELKMRGFGVRWAAAARASGEVRRSLVERTCHKHPVGSEVSDNTTTVSQKFSGPES